jgi:hypothetical protein
MSASRESVRARRTRLQERAAVERDELAGLCSRWQRPIDAFDRGLAIARGFKRNAPVLGIGLGLGMAALAFIRPRSITGWVRNGLAVWLVLTSKSEATAPRSDRAAKS